MSQSELIAIKDAIDGIYKNEIYDNEYTFEESKYIIKEPCIHLDVDKILEDLKNGCCDIKNINNNNINDIIVKGYCFKVIINFPISIKLQDKEYIINIYLLYTDGQINQNLHMEQFPEVKFYIIYMTNYGRIIKTENISYTTISKNVNTGGPGNCAFEQKFYIKSYNYIWLIKENKYYSCGIIGNEHTFYEHKIKLIEQPKLLYRIPRLFIDIIDAFHTQNTDLMQECCKKYLEISRESKVKESIMKDIKIKEITKEKDMIIKEKDNIIEDKNKEIEDLKEQLEILQQKYDKIKSMFN